MFKLYLFDVGLLGYMLGLTYADQRAQSLSFKGYIAENFVQNELSVRVAYPTFGWEQANAQVEFLHRGRDGEIIPVEGKKRDPHPRSQLAVLRGALPGRGAPLSSSGVPVARGKG